MTDKEKHATLTIDVFINIDYVSASSTKSIVLSWTFTMK